MSASSPTTGPSAASSRQVSLSNKSGKPAVVIVPASSASDGGAGVMQIAGAGFALLNTTAGNPVVADGTTASFVLDQSCTDGDGQTQSSTFCTLQVSDADSWFPLASLSVTLDADQDPPAFPPQIVTPADAAVLADAAVFYQTITANPTSDLANQYRSSLQIAQAAATSVADGTANSSQNAANAIESGVDTFFKATAQFKDVTYSAVMAVQQYYTAFPFIWAQYGSPTYYLYGTTGTDSSTAVTFIGTVAFTKPESLDPAKPNFGYGCVFSPASNPADTTKTDVDASKAKSLVYANGLFVDDPTSASPAVAIAGIFLPKSTFTGVGTDTDPIVALTGSVAGSTCLGLDQPRNSSDSDGQGFWDSLLNPQNAAQFIGAVAELAGALFAFQLIGSLLWKAYRWLRSRAAARQPTDNQALENQQQREEAPARQSIEAEVERLSAGRQVAPAELPAANNVAVRSTSIFEQNSKAIELSKSFQAQAERFLSISRLTSSMTESEMTRFRAMEAQFSAISSRLRTQRMEDTAAQFEEISSQIDNFKTEYFSLLNDVSTRRLRALNASVPGSQESEIPVVNNEGDDKRGREISTEEENFSRGINE